MTRRTVISGLALVVLSTLGASGCAHAFKAARKFELSAAWQSYERVVVRSRNGDISLVSGDGSEITVRGTKSARGATPEQAEEHLDQLEIAIEPDPEDASTLLIELRYPEKLRRFSIGANFDIRIPRGCAAHIDTSNGDIVVRGLKDRVDLESSNGSIVIEDIAGSVDARTSNGRVRAKQIQGDFSGETSNGSIFASSITGDCSFITSNGRIEVEQIEGNVSAVTSNGTIRLQTVPRSDARVVMRTSNGNIHVSLPADVSAMVKLQTSNGRIHTDFADAILQKMSYSRNRFECALNGGQSGTVSARTSNGSIRITCR